jgi:prevent-host-death family protein
MIKIDEDVCSLSDFKRNTTALLDEMRRNRRPLVLTVNGKAEIVVQDAKSYQELLDAVEHRETVDAIHRGFAALGSGYTRPAREALSEMKDKRAIQRGSN